MEHRLPVIGVPYKSLEALKSKLALTDADFLSLDRHRDIFISRQNDFAEFFYTVFTGILETKILLERFGNPDTIKRTWARWFERFFRENLAPPFIGYLWGIGMKHVQIGLDQRFSNLGFSLVRRFCHQISIESFTPEEALEVITVLDKLVDFCILVETSSYIEATVRCDIEILKGIADKIRNPVTILGGNLRRLQRHLDPKDNLYKDYDLLISYTSHCEDMIQDITTYMEIFDRDTKFEKCVPETIIDNMLETLSSRGKLEGVTVEVLLSPDARFLWGDPVELRHLFYQVMENAADAARAAEKPYVRISSLRQEAPPHTVRIEVFNNGEVINLDNMAKMLTLFYSTKPKGSGLGLAIVKLVLRKNYGEMYFEPVPQEGTKVFITLQRVE